METKKEKPGPGGATGNREEKKDLKMSWPISEKDEVKEAENRTRKAAGKTDPSVKADLENRKS